MLIPGLFFLAIIALLPIVNIIFTYYYLSHKAQKSHYLLPVVINWLYCILFYWVVYSSSQALKSYEHGAQRTNLTGNLLAS